jgi:hypothetical protein
MSDKVFAIGTNAKRMTGRDIGLYSLVTGEANGNDSSPFSNVRQRLSQSPRLTSRHAASHQIKGGRNADLLE